MSGGVMEDYKLRDLRASHTLGDPRGKKKGNKKQKRNHPHPYFVVGGSGYFLGAQN
jgi:hypothetical protein